MNTWSPSRQRLALRDLEAQLSQLIREYLNRRSSDMAMSVARHIEALCVHPDYRGSWEERCAYRRLARHWNGLAWLAADPSIRPTHAARGNPQFYG
ncbi:MAG: ATP dependent RNA helicase [Gammaproteobacteria bacterium]|nr:ATP dependent RNA helicase [Gammaproteobacteria bacterium]MCP5195999.1 ATP dependent RNA helicase [Gammaproteobacteria bacterium]